MAWHSRLRYLVGAVLVGVFLGAVTSTCSVSTRDSNVTIGDGTVYVGIGQATIKGDDGWSYGVGSDVHWTDASGTWHEGDWPACFPPVGETARVRFAATEVTVSGWRWRPVVWVSCQN